MHNLFPLNFEKITIQDLHFHERSKIQHPCAPKWLPWDDKSIQLSCLPGILFKSHARDANISHTSRVYPLSKWLRTLQGTRFVTYHQHRSSLPKNQVTAPERWPHFRTLGRTPCKANSLPALGAKKMQRASESGARTPPSINTNAVGCLFVQAAFPALPLGVRRETHTQTAARI